jgi:hypothetical protein
MMKNLRRRPRATTAEIAQTLPPRNLSTLSLSPVVTLSLSAGEARLDPLGPRKMEPAWTKLCPGSKARHTETSLSSLNQTDF